MRYVGARAREHRDRERFRVLVTEHLRILLGTEARYAAPPKARDFDAQSVIDDVIDRAGLEVV